VKKDASSLQCVQCGHFFNRYVRTRDGVHRTNEIAKRDDVQAGFLIIALRSFVLVCMASVSTIANLITPIAFPDTPSPTKTTRFHRGSNHLGSTLILDLSADCELRFTVVQAIAAGALEDTNTKGKAASTKVDNGLSSMDERLALSIQGPFVAKVVIQLSGVAIKAVTAPLVDRRMRESRMVTRKLKQTNFQGSSQAFLPKCQTEGLGAGRQQKTKDQAFIRESPTTTEDATLTACSSTMSKATCPIVDSLVAHNPDSQRQKPDNSVPENPTYTDFATLIADDKKGKRSQRPKELQIAAIEIFDNEVKNYVPQRQGASASRSPMRKNPPGNEQQLQETPRQEADKFAAEVPSKPWTQNWHTAIKSAILSGSTPLGSPPSETAEIVLKCLSTKCLSLFNKFRDIRKSVCLERPSILVLTEAWLTPDVSDAEISIAGHSTFRADSIRGKAGGGALYLLAALSDTLVHLFVMHCGFKPRCVRPILFSVWSTVTRQVHRKTTSSSYKLLSNFRPATTLRIFLIGDFNAPKASWVEVQRIGSSRYFASTLTKVVQQSAWAHHVLAPSRYGTGQLPSLLDLVIVNRRHFVDQVLIKAPLGHSDHCVQIVGFIRYWARDPKSQIWIRNFCLADFSEIRIFLDQLEFGPTCIVQKMHGADVGFVPKKPMRSRTYQKGSASSGDSFHQ
ncbi:hypothetical protein CLF_111383, partial [Clonorchis sinensis]